MLSGQQIALSRPDRHHVCHRVARTERQMLGAVEAFLCDSNIAHPEPHTSFFYLHLRCPSGEPVEMFLPGMRQEYLLH